MLVSKFAEMYPKEFNSVFLTLTYKNLPEFSTDGLKKLLYQFRKKFLRSAIIKHILVAGLYAWDWTFTSAGFNIHIHSYCFLQQHLPVKVFRTRAAQRFFSFGLAESTRELQSLQRGFIPQQILSKIWYQATGNSVVVDIRKINNAKSAMFEVMKYVQGVEKINQLDMIQQAQYIEVVKSIRRFSKFGLLYRKKLPQQKQCCNVCAAITQEREYCISSVIEQMSPVEIQADDNKTSYAILARLAAADEWEQHRFRTHKQANELLYYQRQRDSDDSCCT
jgi:hypothetical protein